MNSKTSIKLYLSLMIALCISCNPDVHDTTLPLFSLHTDTGITFNNKLEYTTELNPYTYRNFYNGAGVAIGDINNDGFDDIYFTGNQVNNQLYLNEGNLNFKNITKKAGVECPDIWSSGAVLIDINSDSLLDLYVCKAGPPNGDNRHNELFINNGDLTFTEASAEYGLDITGLGIQSAFFDYDKDGDLDCYLLNNSIKAIGGFDLIKDKRNEHSQYGNKLLRNDNGKFIDVTQESGIYSSEIGFGLGITISDFNVDGWPDVYISNDFFEKDYLYINQKNGHFRESGEEFFHCFSLGSMGADAADLNNDLLPDLMVTEMYPSTIQRKKTKAVYDSWNKYHRSVKAGYYHQVPRNTLQYNVDGDHFIEIGRYAQVEDTDWSWSCLMQDYNNDGYKDIFISNGIYKDLLDRDYLDFAGNEAASQLIQKYKEEGIKQLIDSMTSLAIPNRMFSHSGDFNYHDVNKKWGLDKPSFSNGSAYSDIDNDGDLDLIINNVNENASIYINQEQEIHNNNFIHFSVTGIKKNTFAIGTKIIVYACGHTYMNELYPSRGFQSSVSYKLHFGLGECSVIDSAVVQYPDGTATTLIDIEVNKLNKVEQEKNDSEAMIQAIPQGIFSVVDSLDFEHVQPYFNQFNREPMMYKMNTEKGPIVRLNDIDGDGDEDIFIGGAKNQSSIIYINENGELVQQKNVFQKESKSEVTDAQFFDSDNDGDPDLYIAHGGTAFSKNAPELKDIIYVNDGRGNFIKSENSVQIEKPIATSTVSILDINNDGLLDIFIGSDNSNLSYGTMGSAYLFKNNGDNSFTEIKNNELENIGIITDSGVTDINKDGLLDIIIVGEWMRPIVYINKDGSLIKTEDDYGFNQISGLWNNILVDDINGDEQDDIFIGNIGQNTSITDNTRLYIGDFDNNGSREQILCKLVNEKIYPIVDFDLLRSQVPAVRKKVIRHRDYAESDMNDLFGKETIEKSNYLHIDNTETVLYLSSNNSYKKVNLPQEVQYSSTNAALAHDVNEDGIKDILSGGNHYLIVPQYGRADGSSGWLLSGSNANDEYEIKTIYPLSIDGEIRDIKLINQDKFIFGVNNKKTYLYSYLNTKNIK